MTSSNRRMLVVGNGFDLAHGLPTRYQDMLDALSHDTASWLSLEDRQRYSDNPFIKYFSKYKDLPGWTGFESEIQQIVNYLCKIYDNRRPPTIHGDIESFFLDIRIAWRSHDTKTMWNILQQDLDELISYIDVYLSKYIPTLIPTKLTDNTLYPHFVYTRDYEYLLSFNYTDTFELYSRKMNNGIGIFFPPSSEQFIHGRCSFDGNPQNIVLGIEDNDPSNLDTIYFKKYFQRIQKKTGREVFDWFDEKISSSEPIVTDIFGHSLDTTDKDILMLILEKSRYTNIYYYNQADYEQKIINLVRLYGSPEEFTKRYYNHKIRLRDQIAEDEQLPD